MITPIETVTIRGRKVFVLAERKVEGDDYCPPTTERLLIPCECEHLSHCSTLEGQNLMFQYYFPRDTAPAEFVKNFPDEPLDGYSDDHLTGAWERDYDLADYGFTEDQIEEFIKTLLPK